MTVDRDDASEEQPAAEGDRSGDDGLGTEGRPIRWVGHPHERQEFPVDQESIDQFVAGGATVSTTNVWAVEVRPGEAFVYELSRPNRLLRVEFDLTRPVDR